MSTCSSVLPGQSPPTALMCRPAPCLASARPMSADSASAFRSDSAAFERTSTLPSDSHSPPAEAERTASGPKRGPGRPRLLPWGVFAAFGGLTVLGYSVLAEHFPVAAIGRANAALNVGHIGCSFLLQSGIGQILAHWAPVAGHYPASAYRAAMMLPMTLQIMALARFAWPRKANAGGAV